MSEVRFGKQVAPLIWGGYAAAFPANCKSCSGPKHLKQLVRLQLQTSPSHFAGVMSVQLPMLKND